jgi:hypothetical protein
VCRVGLRIRGLFGCRMGDVLVEMILDWGYFWGLFFIFYFTVLLIYCFGSWDWDLGLGFYSFSIVLFFYLLILKNRGGRRQPGLGEILLLSFVGGFRQTDGWRGYFCFILFTLLKEGRKGGGDLFFSH